METHHFNQCLCFLYVILYESLLTIINTQKKKTGKRGDLGFCVYFMTSHTSVEIRKAFPEVFLRIQASANINQLLFSEHFIPFHFLHLLLSVG